MYLVVVESPTKAKTIKKFLSNDFEVLASVGHIRDIPSKKSEIAANTKRIKEVKYKIPIDKLLSNNKSKGIIKAMIILEKVSKFGIKES